MADCCILPTAAVGTRHTEAAGVLHTRRQGRVQAAERRIPLAGEGHSQAVHMAGRGQVVVHRIQGAGRAPGEGRSPGDRLEVADGWAVADRCSSRQPRLRSV